MQVGEKAPFIDEMLKNLSGLIYDLAPSQVHVFYEAVGHVISSAGDEPDQQADLIEKLTALPNSVWDEIIANAGESMVVLKEPEVTRNLLNILKTASHVVQLKSIHNTTRSFAHQFTFVVPYIIRKSLSSS